MVCTSANMFFDKLLNNKLDYVTAHKRDFIHIEDLCEAVEVIMDSKFNGFLDVGTGYSVRIPRYTSDLSLLS